MEMVEAIIDNNYDVNSKVSNHFVDHEDSRDLKTTSARDEQNNLKDTTSLREPVEKQMSRKKKSRQRKVHRKGEKTMTSNDEHSLKSLAKICKL